MKIFHEPFNKSNCNELYFYMNENPSDILIQSLKNINFSEFF